MRRATPTRSSERSRRTPGRSSSIRHRVSSKADGGGLVRVKLVDITIRDFRSLFVDDRGQPFSVGLADGMNTFVGRNNCGKSNVLRAVAAALDPTYPYERVSDTPGPRQFGHPV